MTREISKPQKCILMMSGIEHWVDAEIAKEIQNDWESPNPPKAIRVNGESINMASVEGIYTPEKIDFMRHKKQNQWQCKAGTWHSGPVTEYCECLRGH